MAMSQLQQPLLRKPASRNCLPKYSAASVVLIPALVALGCVGVGMYHPLAVESSKSARMTRCALNKVGHVDCSRVDDDVDERQMVMPFHMVSLTIGSELASVIIALTMLSWNRNSLQSALKTVLDPRALLELWPIGFIYGLGDFMQTHACNSASAPVVLVVSQSKLLLAALLTKFFMRAKKNPIDAQWAKLFAITAAAAAGAHRVSELAITEYAKQAELIGAALAFAKALLSSSGAVLSESFYNNGNDEFWAVSFKVQFMMLMTSLLLLITVDRSMSYSGFLGGPHTLCTDFNFCDPSLLPGGTCTCVDRSGWDRMTVFAMTGLIANGAMTGLVLKHLSAVAKSICSACSVASFYVGYVILGFKPFDFPQMCIIIVIICTSWDYTREQIRMKAEAARLAASPTRASVGPCEAGSEPLDQSSLMPSSKMPVAADTATAATAHRIATLGA